MYSGDIEWLQSIWSNYTRAVAYLEGKVDSSGLVNITGLRDWARLGGGGHNAEGNAIYYKVGYDLLVTILRAQIHKVVTNSVELAGYLNQTSQASAWARNATIFKTTFNDAFWLESAGMYRDNTTTTLCPQDANSFAILFNLTTTDAQANSISGGLEQNWNDLGSIAPELPDNISPFIGGFEVSFRKLSR